MVESISNLVSVIIPTYNRSGFLKEAIQSVYAQTYRPIECIVVDDGSTDDTDITVMDLQRLTDAQFKLIYIKQDNAGAQVARNTGTSAANGEYIQYLDSDDLLYPDKLKSQVSYLAVHPECDAVFGDWESGTTQSKNLIKGFVSQNLVKQMLTLERSIHTSAILFRKSIVTEIDAWDIQIKRCQEIDFHLRGLMLGAVYHYHPLITGLWRYHENDRIHNTTGVDAFIGFYQKWERILNEKGLFTKEIAEKIADWYMCFLTQSKQQAPQKIILALQETVRLKPSIKFYNTYKMRLLRLFLGKRIALKLWLKHYLQNS